MHRPVTAIKRYLDSNVHRAEVEKLCSRDWQGSGLLRMGNHRGTQSRKESNIGKKGRKEDIRTNLFQFTVLARALSDAIITTCSCGL